MKTQYFTATSLDGFIATEDDSLEWLFPLGNVADTSYSDFIRDVGALAMGSATYEWMLRHADAVAKETGSPWPYTQPTWVFTILAQTDAAGVPHALQVYEKLRRERVADVQLGARKHGLRVDSMSGDLAKRDAELAAHAEFRKQLYSYDVEPLAKLTA